MRPYDDKGRFVRTACPRANCGNGTLQHVDGRFWECNGLADPGDDNKPLEACGWWHYDGEAIKP